MTSRTVRTGFMVAGALGLAVAVISMVQSASRRREPGTPLVRTQVAAIAEAVVQYRATIGTLPDESGGQVAGAVLLGRNPRGMEFIHWRTGAVGKDGEPLDPWGRPFQIKIDAHKSEVEVRSAGPNGTFGDSDDEVGVRPLHADDDRPGTERHSATSLMTACVS